MRAVEEHPEIDPLEAEETDEAEDVAVGEKRPRKIGTPEPDCAFGRQFDRSSR